jgi:hypothetical protein
LEFCGCWPATQKVSSSALTPPPPLETLAPRMLAFLFQFADLCELLAERLRRPFAEMLDEAWAGFGLGATARIEIGDQENI